MLGKAPPVAVVQRHRDTFALAERRRDRIGETATILRGGRDPVYDNEHVLAGPHASFDAIIVQPNDCSVDLGPDKTGCSELRRDFDVGTMRGCRKRKCHDRFAFPVSRDYGVHHLLYRIPLHLLPAMDARLDPRARPQKPQEISDFRSRADR